MTAQTFRRLLLGCLLHVVAPSTPQLSAQDAELVYISNVTGVQRAAAALTTIEEQTAATLDNLGTALRERGLDYSDMVASNV